MHRKGSCRAALKGAQVVNCRTGVVLNSPIAALAHLGLARAYVLSGDTVKAKSAYQDFFGRNDY
jgi:hypothetical protein